MSGWGRSREQLLAEQVRALLAGEGGPADAGSSRAAPPENVHALRVALLAAALKDEMLARTLLDIYVAPLEDDRGGGAVLRAARPRPSIAMLTV